jgi:hypothetical protein
MSESKNKSGVPEINVPRYDPCIPDHMLDSINDKSTKYIMEQLSIMQQNRDWQNSKIQEIYQYTNKINGQVIALSEFKLELLKQMAVEDSLMKEQEKSKQERLKLYKIMAGVFLFVVYPLFISQWTPGSVLQEFVKSLF